MVAMQSTMAMSFTISAPFMPFFLASLGVTPTANVAMWTGAIASAGAFTIALVSPFWGALADRTGRKPMIVRCCFLSSLCFATIGFCHEAWQVCAVMALSGICGGFSTAAMTLVGSQAPEGRLGYALGWMATGQLTGGLAGPLVGGLLADRFHDYRLVFVSTALAALLAALTATAFVRERFERPAAAHARTPWHEQAGEIVRHPTLLPLVFVLLLAQLTAYAASPVIPLYVQSLVGDVPWLSTASGSAIAIVGVAGILAAPWLGRRGDRIGYRRVLIISLGGAALFTFPQVVSQSFAMFVALRFGVGLFLGGILPSANALIGRTFPRERLGRIYGLTSSASYLGLASGPAVGGFVAAHFGFAAVFVTIGTLILVNLALVLIIPAERAPEPAPA